MRHYHVEWVMRLSYLAMLTGFGFMAISWFDSSFEWGPSLMKLAMPLIIASILPNLVIKAWLSFRKSDNLVSPTCPEGLPMDPSGIWISDEMQLEVGDRVLALSQGRWHRAVILGFKSQNRILVHFTGWDEYWDSVFPRSKLQVDPKSLPENKENIDREDETGIRAI